MEIKVSPALNYVIKNANSLVDIYGTSALTPAHFVLALLWGTFNSREKNTPITEFENAIQYTPVGSDTEDFLIKNLIEYLKVKKDVPNAEKKQLNKLFKKLAEKPFKNHREIASAEDLFELIRMEGYGIVSSLYNILDLKFSVEAQKQGYNFTDLTKRPDIPIANSYDSLRGVNLSTYIRNAIGEAKSINHKKSLKSELDSEKSTFDFTFVVDEDCQFPIIKNYTAPDEKSVINSDFYSAKKLEDALREVIYGQDEAIATMATGYYNAKSKSGAAHSANKPLATFLFAGAPGVGKTFLAEKAAEFLKLPFRRFDMSSFSDKESALEFAGTDNVYKNGHEGLVTGFVRNNPHCVILFDEIEKAHINVIHLFLQILDNATLKDSFLAENVNFDKAIIIMTTNAGKNLYDLAEAGTAPPGREVILNALKNDINPQTNAPFFPAAICSRFAMGNIVVFNPLRPKDILSIINGKIEKHTAAFSDKHGVTVSVDERVPVALLFSEGGKGDARSLSGRTENFLAQEIYNWLKFFQESHNSFYYEINKLNIKLNLNKCPRDIRSLFVPQGKMNVLLYSEFTDTFERFENNKQLNFITTTDYNEALDIIKREEVDFAICDIRSGSPIKNKNNLNIEDIETSGRKLFKAFNAENIPFYVLNYVGTINSQERLALMEQGVRDLFYYDLFVNYERLKKIRLEINYERKLNEFSRANKVLSFDCSYVCDCKKREGTILIENLHISPAVDAEDLPQVANVSTTSVKFNDIIGAEDAKSELKDFVSYLKNPKIYARNGIPAPKGVLLYGPPGTGKTMLAKALATEAGATFIAAQGNQFLKPVVGGAGAEIKNIFALARKYAPAILFIDEIDIIAKNRMGGYSNSSTNEAVNALLNEMDGFSTNPTKPVFVLGATNFDGSFGTNGELDPALLRRFDRRIFVALPDKEDRVKFIRQRLQKSNKKIESSFIENVAIRSTGMSLAELENVIDFALRQMLRANETELTPKILDEAFETFRFGEKISWNKDVLKRVAIHESGHAFVGYKRNKPPLYISVSSRKSFGGYVEHDTTDSPVLTKADLLDQICMCLAGRAAEIEFLGEDEGISTGASSDLRMATSIAMQMITRFGMTTEGLAVDETPDDNKEALDLCNEILKTEMENARRLISDNKEKVCLLADTLADKNHLTGAAVEKILKKQRSGSKQSQ